jgi:hypothetical protein
MCLGLITTIEPHSKTLVPVTNHNARNDPRQCSRLEGTAPPPAFATQAKPPDFPESGSSSRTMTTEPRNWGKAEKRPREQTHSLIPTWKPWIVRPQPQAMGLGVEHATRISPMKPFANNISRTMNLAQKSTFITTDPHSEDHLSIHLLLLYNFPPECLRDF